jgi:hypothetical protein
MFVNRTFRGASVDAARNSVVSAAGVIRLFDGRRQQPPVIALATRQHAREEPAAPVSVIGYTDSAGRPAGYVLLSQQRAQTLADALVASGAGADRRVRSGRGQTGGVEITLAPN